MSNDNNNARVDLALACAEERQNEGGILNYSAGVLAAEFRRLREESAQWIRDCEAFSKKTGLVPIERLEEVYALGKKQADEFDRYWKAAGVLDASVSVDDAIARYQALTADLAARDALCGELRDGVAFALECTRDTTDSLRLNTLQGRMKDLLAKTPEDFGAELARLRLTLTSIGKVLEPIGFRAHWQEVDGLVRFYQLTLGLFAGARIFNDVEAQVEALRAQLADKEADAKLHKDMHGVATGQLIQAEAKLAALVSAGDAMRALIESYIVSAGHPDAEDLAGVAAWDAAKTGAQVPDGLQEEKWRADAGWAEVQRLKAELAQVPDVAELMRDKARLRGGIAEALMHLNTNFCIDGQSMADSDAANILKETLDDTAVDAVMEGGK